MEQFEQLLTCAICLDRYRNPKLLPCQHSFCMEPCMDGLVDYVRRQVKCPECRAEHRIPYQGVQAFPTNVTLQRFLELHIEITGELPDPTSGQTMERCGVCSEKSYCSLCVHCEKKCCPECKDAHMDILRREITRINSQIRRGLHRLQDALALVEKNTLGLQTNCASVAEEVDEIYRRLSKALKDRTEHLRNEVDRYLGTELRGLIQLKENLELEIANIQSNCDLAEAHINENVPWDDSELLDTKELFLRTVEFIRNFEYEAGDYSRRVRFVMAHDPNQLVLHVAGYGELNIKPEAGSGGLLGSSSSLAPPGGSPGLMRSKSDHRLASQYRQQEEERLARNRYVPEYEYDAPEYEVPRNKSRYRSRFMRHRDGDDSDGDSRSTVRFTSTPQEPSGLRERVLDTEDAARGPLSGIFRLTDSPRIMKKLQEYERAGKRKKEEPVSHPAQQPQPPKPQVQVRKVPTAMARQTSEDDEISRIKKQNKTAATPTTETLEERQPVSTPTPVHPPPREQSEREPEEPARRPMPARRTSTDTHTPATRSASSDSSTGSESSGGSGIRSTGAPFTAEEMKQKYLSRAPTSNATSTISSPHSGTPPTAKDTANASPTSRSFQSRFLGTGNRAAPPPPTQPPPAAREETAIKKKEEEEEDDEETSSSSEETESETEEESETDAHPSGTTTSTTPSTTAQDRQRSESAMARTDIGPLLARSAEARRGSKEDSPTTRYSSPRGSPAHSVTSPTTTTTTTPTGGAATTPAGYTSRTFSDEHDEPSNTDRVEDYEIAAKNADYDIVGADGSMVKPQSNKRTYIPDDSTDTDETITSSSSSSATRFKSLEGNGNDSRVENRSEVNEDALMEGRSGNDVNSSLSAWTDRRASLAQSSTIRDNGYQPDKTASSNGSLETSRETVINGDGRKYANGSSDKSNNVESSSESESESGTESATDSDSERDEEEDKESRDENSNIMNKKTENPEQGRASDIQHLNDTSSEDESTSSETDDQTTVLSVPSNSHSEDSYTVLERYDDRSTKRRSSSILDDKSIEELFDDNGWVITDQDLQAEKPRTISKGFKSIDRNDSGINNENTDNESSSNDEKSNILDSDTMDKEDNERTENEKALSVSESSESLSRSRAYRQSSIGKNGWLVSDESETESDRATSPVEDAAIRTESDTTDASKNVASIEDERMNDDDASTPMSTTVNEKKSESGKDSMVADSVDENGWVILNKVNNTSTGKNIEGGSMDETSTIRSQTTDLVARTNIENGALVANATQSKETETRNEHEDTPGVDITIPMQMVPEQEQKPGGDDGEQGTRTGARKRTRTRTRTRKGKRAGERARTRRGHGGRFAAVDEVTVRRVEREKTTAGSVQKLAQLRRR
ncbi:serine-rich adhesin for platelets isoform X1 [Bombus pyrosoma]|uniref:serine-rich adhesin for platelets isoform X1 n=1 Tax=Bombus pyrosoma TaxID=396416 RepID=UPI001CB9A5E8|nr:serine-rich adhesin for platelets isoform X1 [Bombus pyrosoma]XP_043597283.1 serine-rich adhesin for platelets isoform X1 [Bombus pyrosoma]XP_043597284.1 serine-rich adhesin for platelets isoform X1 [Bombus pyrosoma]XP_043597286.1 serine-rich adhesin for platelets isoform X1 [Bombus pyrosoma]